MLEPFYDNIFTIHAKTPKKIIYAISGFYPEFPCYCNEAGGLIPNFL